MAAIKVAKLNYSVLSSSSETSIAEILLRETEVQIQMYDYFKYFKKNSIVSVVPDD